MGDQDKPRAMRAETMKIRNKFRPFGCFFHLFWVKDDAQVKDIISQVWIFWVCEGKSDQKVKIFGVIKFWTSLYKMDNILKTADI